MPDARGIAVYKALLFMQEIRALYRLKKLEVEINTDVWNIFPLHGLTTS